MVPDQRMRQLLHKATSDMIDACARQGLRGLDIFGMLAAASAAQFEVIRAASAGIVDKNSISPEARDLDLIARYRACIEDMMAISRREALLLVDEAAEVMMKASGMHDRTTAPAPTVSQVQAMYDLKERS